MELPVEVTAAIQGLEAISCREVARGRTPPPTLIGLRGREVIGMFIPDEFDPDSKTLVYVRFAAFARALDCDVVTLTVDSYVSVQSADGPLVPASEDPTATNALVTLIAFRSGSQLMRVCQYSIDDHGEVTFDEPIVKAADGAGGAASRMLKSAVSHDERFIDMREYLLKHLESDATLLVRPGP